MLASRLLSILMLLQARGHMSAVTLAREFEVSVRTIHRDIDQPQRRRCSGLCRAWADEIARTLAILARRWAREPHDLSRNVRNSNNEPVVS